MFLLLLEYFLVFSFLEVATRIFCKPPPSVLVENLNKPGENNYTEYGKFSVLPDGKIISEGLPGGFFLYSHSGTRLKKNVRGIVHNHSISKRDVTIMTNAQGFRYRTLAEKRADEIRILVLGDSITFGDYVSQEETYPAVIEKFLRKSEKGKKISVINAGVGAIDFQNEFAILMEEGLAVKPDIVLVGLYLNDAYESPVLKVLRLPRFLSRSHFLRFLFAKIDKLQKFYAVHQWEQQSKDEVKKEREQFRKNNPIVDQGTWDTEAEFNWHIDHAFFDWGYAWTEGYWKKILPLIDLMQEVSRDQNFQLAFIYLPVRYQADSKILRNEPQARFEKEMTKRGIPHLDLLPFLRMKFQKDKVNVFYDHCHYTPEGNAYIGFLVAKFLELSFRL